jgi:hypothetical protein
LGEIDGAVLGGQARHLTNYRFGKKRGLIAERVTRGRLKI